MRHLIGLELRRWHARRLLWIFAALVVAGNLISLVSVFLTHADEAGPTVTEQRQVYDDCYERASAPPNEFGISEDDLGSMPDAERERACSFVTASHFATGTKDAFRLTQVLGAWTGTTGPFTAMVLVLAASFIGAEWRSGSLATQLTWESRRARLLLTKAGVAIAMGTAFFVLAQALVLVALLPSVIWRGTTAGADADWWSFALGLLGRGSAFAAMGAAAGFAFASVGRNTAASLGVMFGYIALAEGFLINLIDWLRPWLVLPNAIVFVGGRGIPGEFFDRTPLQSGVILGCYAAGVIAIATIWFARRDVT